jgi:hypothetical protein
MAMHPHAQLHVATNGNYNRILAGGKRPLQIHRFGKTSYLDEHCKKQKGPRPSDRAENTRPGGNMTIPTMDANSEQVKPGGNQLLIQAILIE